MATGKRKIEAATGEAAAAKLDAFGIDWYCEQIVSGKNMNVVAKLAGVSRRSVYRWLAADADRFNQAQEARLISAEAFDDLAEQCIKEAKSPLALDKAKALAPHYRWRASKIAPKTYGDRQELVGAGGTPLIPEIDPVDGARRIAFILERAKSRLEHEAAISRSTASSS